MIPTLMTVSAAGTVPIVSADSAQLGGGGTVAGAGGADRRPDDQEQEQRRRRRQQQDPCRSAERPCRGRFGRMMVVEGDLGGGAVVVG